jgi:cytoskeletal protein CcmA (bactofilin family)
MDLHRRYYPETRLPAGITVAADLRSSEDIALEGQFDGDITVPDHHVEIGASARVRAKIVARSVTIHGSLDGTVIAGERVDVERTASVQGHVTTPSFALFEGAKFNGTVDPARTEAAMRVAAYRQKNKP